MFAKDEDKNEFCNININVTDCSINDYTIVLIIDYSTSCLIVFSQFYDFYTSLVYFIFWFLKYHTLRRNNTVILT